ncbi:cation:proton antiporter [Lacrimispora amygdalina]|uniref:cation:proton antiporter n=1 Tax=Lacrimispora amygdalina TaxID=253257 RepID=UPI000BE25F6B|nr:cation:proton antiporter [Lacrimispora amygdalina]
MNYSFLLNLTMILLSTKVLGLVTRKFHMPQVVGALLAGVILGPAMLGTLHETEFLDKLAEIGVIVLMFCAGLETDTKELMKSGKSAFIIALIGVIVPLIGGFWVAEYFNRPDRIPSDASCPLFLQNMFIGVILTATSVSITAETLKEIGKIKTHSGNAILGAAIIDDVLGIIALTIISSTTDPNVNLFAVLFKIAAFFVFSAVGGALIFHVYSRWSNHAERGLQRHVIAAFSLCLLMSYIAEHFFGVADITGAYIAGIIISNTQKSHFLTSKFDTLSYLLLSPVFFASIGLKVELPPMTPAIVLFAIFLTLTAILTKVIGCGIGAKIGGYKNYQSIRIGVGMISRGEVALIVAGKGQQLGLLSGDFIGPVVLVVIITTVITPILLKPVFQIGPSVPFTETRLGESYEEVSKYR